MGLRNRYRLASSNGPLWLTVPILGGREQRTAVGRIGIDNQQPWQRTHWRSIASIYRRTPFFEHYEPSLYPLFHTPYASLAAFNTDTICWCRQALRFSITPELHARIPETGDFLDRRERWLDWHPFPSRSYHQPFVERIGFVPGASVLDLLFNEGPAAGSFIS